MKRSKLRLGVPQNDYNVDRNVVGSMPSWLRRVRPIDLHRVKNAVGHRCGRPVRQRDSLRFSRPYLIDCDLFHFFNTVPAVSRPWITTFEGTLPHHAVPDRAAGYRRLRGEWCRGLIAFSEASRRVAESTWAAELPPADARDLGGKVEVLLPPQPILRPPAEPPRREEIRFAFVGADFYRKGGLELLEALRRIHAAGRRNWRAVVVGNLDALGDYASRADESCRQRARELLADASDRIVHHRRLSRAQVLELLEDSDYFVLPTLADTFGYAVLEAQACGAVAITTNVRSLPEFMSDACGYVLELPLDEHGDAHTLPGFDAARARLTDALEATLATCCESGPEQRLAKAAAATANLRLRHDPEEHRRRLDSIYRRALSERADGFG